MSPAKKPQFSFNLPTGETHDVYLVKLADGRTVARTKDELTTLPPALAPHFDLGGTGQTGGQGNG